MKSAICVILINSGKPEKDVINNLKVLSGKFEKKSERGIKF